MAARWLDAVVVAPVAVGVGLVSAAAGLIAAGVAAAALNWHWNDSEGKPK